MSSFSLSPAAHVLFGDNEVGPREPRVRTRDPSATARVTFRFLGDDYQTFVNWWKVDLAHGHKWFVLPIPSSSGFIECIVRFTDRYNAQYDGHVFWTVTADIEIRDRFAVQTPFAFLEDFESGFTAYTPVSGDTSIYTIVSGINGHCMHCEPQSSGTVAKIRRVLAEPVTANFLSFRSRVTIVNSDDGCILTLSNGDGNARFHFNPIRENAYDSLRRPQVHFWNGTSTVQFFAHTSALTVGTVYRCDITFSATPNSTHFELIDESTGTIIHSETLSGTYQPITFDRIEFVTDSGNLTCEVDYDDIYCT